MIFYFTERTIFWNKVLKKLFTEHIKKNIVFYWTNDDTEWRILQDDLSVTMNEQNETSKRAHL